jgi:Thiamine monophosphate synthase
MVFDGPRRREAAPVGLVNYAGVGGVYATLSKEQKSPPIGLEGLSRIAHALRRRAPQLPIVGIAGIDAGNAGPVIGAGADGVAVISALSLAADPTTAARAARYRRRHVGKARHVAPLSVRRRESGTQFLAPASALDSRCRGKRRTTY